MFGPASVLSVAGGVAVNVLAAAVIVLLVWFRDFVVLRLALFWRWTYSWLTRTSYVLLWIDDEHSHARKLIRRVSKEMETEPKVRTSFRAVRRPRALRFYPLNRHRTRAIVLLDTDVSKLADEPRVARRVEERLRRYVENGGGLIGSHDLIYRRVRAESLQEVFGCRITHFEGHREQPVGYRINPAHREHPLRRELDDEFHLEDGEVCWGDWAPDVAVIYTTADDHGHPLIVGRDYAEGRIVWLNSGDKAQWLCASIAKPEDALVTILRNALDWVAESR